jgi:hypothetical protein
MHRPMSMRSHLARTGVVTVAALVAAGVTAPAQAVAPATSFHYTSASGDFVGAGDSLTFTPTNAIFRPHYEREAGASTSMIVDFQVDDGMWLYDLEFAPPVNEQLHVGTYTGAQRAAFRTPGAPGLNVDAQGRACNVLYGSFTISALTTDAAGRLTAFKASFTQHCEKASAPPLTGTITYNR